MDQLPQMFPLKEREKTEEREEGSSRRGMDHAYWFALEKEFLLMLKAEMVMGEKDSHVEAHIFHIYICHIHPG